jgi:zinc/manganese transport system permease protein
VLELMLPAFVASVILVGIHGYLGIHIIARGVIFVDLALAQMAAMGWAAATLGLGQKVSAITGLPVHESGYAVGLAATLLGAGLLSLSRLDHPYIPQEAIIGIVFVVASAGTILLASQAPRGSEHVEALLTGSLLWVTWHEIIKTLVMYLIIGAIHWLLRKRFFTISLRPDEARARRWSLTWWDFLFYALFGVVVTSSVEIAGVLVVFSFLVIPAVIAFLFTATPRRLITIAWSAGTGATVLGLYVSYVTDWPTGPVVVCSFAAALLAAFAVRRLVPQLSKAPSETLDSAEVTG